MILLKIANPRNITCEGAIVCIENEAPEGLPRGILNDLSTDCPLALQIQKEQSVAGSDPDNAIQYSSTLMNSSALCNIKQSAFCTSGPDLLLQSQQAQVAISQVDHENEQSQRETVQLQNRKEHSNLPCELHECQICRPSNKHSQAYLQTVHVEFIKNYGTHIIVKMAVGGQDVICVKQNPSSTISSADLKLHLEDLGDFLFSDGKNLSSIHRQTRDGKSKVPDAFVRMVQQPNNLHHSSYSESSTKDGLTITCSKRGGDASIASHSIWLQTVPRFLML